MQPRIVLVLTSPLLVLIRLGRTLPRLASRWRRISDRRACLGVSCGMNGADPLARRMPSNTRFHPGAVSVGALQTEKMNVMKGL